MKEYSSLRQIVSLLLKEYKTGGMEAVYQKIENMNPSEETMNEIKKIHSEIDKFSKTAEDVQKCHKIGLDNSEILFRNINQLASGRNDD